MRSSSGSQVQNLGAQEKFIVFNRGVGVVGKGRGLGRLGQAGGGVNCGNLGQGSRDRDFP